MKKNRVGVVFSLKDRNVDIVSARRRDDRLKQHDYSFKNHEDVDVVSTRRRDDRLKHMITLSRIIKTWMLLP